MKVRELFRPRLSNETQLLHFLAFRRKGLERIVILGSNTHVNDDLIRLVKFLFPECEICVAPAKTNISEDANPTKTSVVQSSMFTVQD